MLGYYYNRRYNPFLAFDAEQKYQSLRSDHSHVNAGGLEAKRHSLDSRTVQNIRRCELLENIEEEQLGVRHREQLVKKEKKGVENNLRAKYYWKTKRNKSNRAGDKLVEKNKVSKAKRAWSQLEKKEERALEKLMWKGQQKKTDKRKQKIDDYGRIELEEKQQSRKEVSNGCSNDSYFSRNSPIQKLVLKKAQSMLNSTMLTKRQHEEHREPRPSAHKYDQMLAKVGELLEKYHKKVEQLRDQKDYYKLKWRQEKKRKNH